MGCGKSSPTGPKQNQLLLNLLWKQYEIKYGSESLPTTTTIMPAKLNNDIQCRLIHLKSLAQALKVNLNRDGPLVEVINSQIEDANELIDQLESVRERIEKLLSDIDDDTDTDDDDNDDNNIQLNRYANEYIELLTGDRAGNRKCERFIKICEQLLYYNEKVEFEQYFPSLNNIMKKWELILCMEEDAEPKVIEAFKAMEADLRHRIITSIPCRVGFIGNISTGKTSLLNWLRGIKYSMDENDVLQYNASDNNTLVSPVRVGKSTYCRLEFGHEYDDKRKVIFVDIEGSTDTDTHIKSANYYDEILKADCDLYIIVFDNTFTDIQQGWYTFTTEQLKRECWLVRTKTDELFRKTFQEVVGQSFDSVSEASRNKNGKKIFDQIRHDVSIDIHGKKLPYVHLTFTSYDRTLSRMTYSKTDMEKLAKAIEDLPDNMHQNRLKTMAMNAMAQVINNCFRRTHAVNVMKYNVLAGVAAAIPFGDLFARYCGREDIRQTFGINDHSRWTHAVRGTTDEFKDYLKQFHIVVGETGFKTSAFNSTFEKKPVLIETLTTDRESTAANDSTNRRSTIAKDTTNVESTGIKSATGAGSVAAKGAATISIAAVSVSDDVLRAIGVSAINGIRGLSTGFIVVGGVVSIGLCIWAGFSNNNQMCSYLNRLCDDLIIVSGCVAAKIIEDNDPIDEDETSIN